MFLKGIRYVFMDAATDGEGGGAGGDAVTEAEGASGGGVVGTGETGRSGSSTEATSETAATALQEGAQPAQIPEKYQVKKEDGSLDIEASSLKLAEAYGHLEKRMGSGDVPPKTAEEYAITVPDAMKDVWKPEEDTLLQDFKKDAHAAGLTQKQFDFVMGKYMDIAPGLVEGSNQLSADDCVADLRKEWKTDEQYKAEVGKSYKAAVAYFGDDADAMIKEYGNDPRFIRGMARIGNELGEDRSLSNDGGAQGGQSVEVMMASDAYTNPKHADHARVSAQIAKHFQKQATAAEKAGNAPLM